MQNKIQILNLERATNGDLNIVTNYGTFKLVINHAALFFNGTQTFTLNGQLVEREINKYKKLIDPNEEYVFVEDNRTQITNYIPISRHRILGGILQMLQPNEKNSKIEGLSYLREDALEAIEYMLDETTKRNPEILNSPDFFKKIK